jgi:hypothetical protein
MNRMDFRGTGVGLIHQVLPAGDIVGKVRKEVIDILDQKAAEYVPCD